MYKTDDITIIDNFLSKEDFDRISNSIISPEWPWTCGPSISASGYGMKEEDIDIEERFDRQLVNVIYNTSRPRQRFKSQDLISEEYRLLMPIFKKLSLSSKNLERVKVNLSLCKERTMCSGYHVDATPNSDGKGMTAVYYLNTNNGKTIFKNGHECESVENRIVIFPNTWYHKPQYQTDTAVRVVINLNWLLDKYLNP